MPPVVETIDRDLMLFILAAELMSLARTAVMPGVGTRQFGMRSGPGKNSRQPHQSRSHCQDTQQIKPQRLKLRRT